MLCDSTFIAFLGRLAASHRRPFETFASPGGSFSSNLGRSLGAALRGESYSRQTSWNRCCISVVEYEFVLPKAQNWFEKDNKYAIVTQFDMFWERPREQCVQF
jgi:hypothetical protein